MVRRLIVALVMGMVVTTAALAKDDAATPAGRKPFLLRTTDKKEEFLDRKAQMRDEVKERMQTRREELKDKLQSVKDARRRKLAEKLHDNMCKVRENRVAAMNRHLQSMTNILSRVEEKAAGNAPVLAAVQKAKSAIAAAQTAVNGISSANCGLDITGDEAKLGPEAKSSLQELTAQIRAVHAKVALARKAVGEAIQVLARVLGEK